MAYLKIILQLLSVFKSSFETVSKYLKQNKRKKEVSNQRELEKEVEKKVENGTQDDVDDLNKFFKS